MFTPPHWAEFAVRSFGLFERWINGATVFDPAMGEGNLLEALVHIGLATGRKPEDLPLNRLFGNELNTRAYMAALYKFRANYGVDLSANFFNEDILDLEPQTYDIIFGNPPWQNFTDLPDVYKEWIKPQFFRYGLVGSRHELLLGGSRIDLAALIIRRVIKEFLAGNGIAVFFMPLSILHNEGVHRAFRSYNISGTAFSPEKIYDLNDEDAFEGVNTRYGLASFRRDRMPEFPVPYLRLESGAWKEYQARPLFRPSDPLSVYPAGGPDPLSSFRPIEIPRESAPRQGVNTCGANDIFFFGHCREGDQGHVVVSNKSVHQARIPKEFIFPLINTDNFREGHDKVMKWVLLPYLSNGKPLSEEQIRGYPALFQYLSAHREALQKRKGIMLRSMVSRGLWWAMLGVGPYSFFPYKVVWEAYGRSRFEPRIFEGHWQAAQSLQAFIPLKSRDEAEKILEALKYPAVEAYLHSMNMAGTMNWAQPGRIRALLRIG